MLKKEWNELIFQSLIFTGILVIFPGLLILIRGLPGLTYSDAFFPMCQFGLFFWAFFLGASFLSSDWLQRSVVYLLSLPFSRLRLFYFKALPRFMVLSIFYGLYLLIVFLRGGDYTAISFISFSLIYFTLFVIALSVSACSDNFLVLFFTTLFGLAVFWGLQVLFILTGLRLRGYLFYEFDIHTFFSGELDGFLVRLIPGTAFLLLVPVLISFVWAFMKFDARPLSVFNKRHLVRLGGIFLVSMAAALLFAYQSTDINDAYYYLTRDHKVIRIREYSPVKIFSQNSEHTISGPVFDLYPLFEIGDAMYFETFQGIERINLIDFSRENLYTCPAGREIGFAVRFFSETLGFLSYKKDYLDLRLELYDLSTHKIQSISLGDDLLWEGRFLRIFGADSLQGERFWLLVKRNSGPLSDVYRIWENGRIEKIAETLKSPLYVNHMLLTFQDMEIQLSKDPGTGFEAVKVLSNPKSFSFYWGYENRIDLNNPLVKEVYGSARSSETSTRRNQRLLARLDLINLRLEPLEDLTLYPRFVGPDEYYCLEIPDRESDKSDVRLHRLEKGRLSSSVVIYPDIDFEDYIENVYIQLFAGGLVAERKGKVSIYAFPDFTELKFKGLN